MPSGDVEASSSQPYSRANGPIQREHQRDMLHFSNSIGNTGANYWQVSRSIQHTKTR